jgi:hypothetical protein
MSELTKLEPRATPTPKPREGEKVIRKMVQVRIAVAIDRRGHFETYSDGIFPRGPEDDDHAIGHARQALCEREEISDDEVESFILSTEREVEYIEWPLEWPG